MRFHEWLYGTGRTMPLEFERRKGPCSVQKPKATLLAPGPPLVQKTSGSFAGLRADSTNQKYSSVPAASPMGSRPAYCLKVGGGDRPGSEAIRKSDGVTASVIEMTELSMRCVACRPGFGTGVPGYLTRL